MRIAEVVCSFPPYGGGTGQVAYNNALALARAGHEVTVFTIGLGKAKTENDFFKVKYLWSLIKIGNAAFLPQLIWKLRNFDLIHLHYPFFGAAEIIALGKRIGWLKAKLIITYHQDALASGLKGRFFSGHSRFLAPFILRQAKKIIVSSLDYLENSSLKIFFQENKNLFQELPLGVDVEFYSPRERNEQLFKEYKISPREKVILFVGGLDKAHYFKGVRLLIKAFYELYKENNWAKLVIIGEGDLRFEYEQLAFNLGLRDKVIFTGKVSNEKKRDFLNLAWVLVLPSINRGEAFGIVLVEAMSSGTPVIASNLPGVRKVVKDGETGFLVKPGDIEDLKEKLAIILNDKDLQEKMGKKARERVLEKYNQRDLNKKFIKLF